MSIFGAVTTAVSGLNAQSKAFSNLGNNIANSQTNGYKARDTAFQDLVASTERYTNDPNGNDSVAARTVQHNDVQGTITQSTNSLALAISGNGFFSVEQPVGNVNSATPTFSGQRSYTRNGDFSTDKNGYLVNTSGSYLDGYQVDRTGRVSNTLAPVQVGNVSFRPTRSTALTVSGAIGSASQTGVAKTLDATAYDVSGNASTVKLDWQQNGTDPHVWTVNNGADAPTTVTFNTDGTLASVGGNSTSGSAGTFSFTGSPQNMTVNLGTIGTASGLSLNTSQQTTSDATMTSDSVTTGNYQGVAMTSDGSVMATFDNGQSQLIAKIPLATFANVNGLSPQDGQNFLATAESGNATINTVGTGGAGTLDTSSVEGSTTDLTSNLSQLILAQQAYGANTKVVTAADQLLQTTLAMIQ